MPKPRPLHIALAASLVIGLSYWAVSFFAYPDEPFIMKVLARNQADFNYFILPALLSNGLYPTGVLEGESLGMISIPIMSLPVHTLCVALFGQVGFLLADLFFFALVTAAAYIFFLRIHGNEKFACVFALGLLLSVMNHSVSYGHWINTLSLRWPRPFLALPFLLLALRYMLDLWKDPTRLQARQLVIFGASLAILGQSNLHMMVAIATGAVVFFIKNAAQYPRRLPKFLQVVMWAGIGFAVAFSPLLIQKLLADPEFGTRLGMHPLLDRIGLVKDYLMGPSGRTNEVHRKMRLFGGLLALELILRAGLRRYGASEIAKRFEFTIPLTVICLAAGFAMPFFSLVAGVSVQGWHFIIPPRSLWFILYYSVGTAVVAFAAREAAKRFSLKRFADAGFAIAIITCVAISFPLSERYLHRSAIFGGSTHWNWLASVKRRANSAEVFRFVDDHALPSDTVLAGLGLGVRLKDLVHAWWYNTGHPNTLYPNSFVTTLSDDELVLRGWASHILLRGGLPQTQTQRLADVTGGDSKIAQNERGLEFCARYSANRFWRLSEDLGDYTPEQRKRIQGASWDQGWFLIMPQSEIQRWMKLMRAHEDGIQDRYRVDIAISKRAVPQVKGFRLVFANRAWKVWVNEDSTVAELFADDRVEDRRTH